MNLRTTSLLFLVLVVLAALAMFLQRSREEELTAEGDLLFPSFDAEQVDHVELRTPDREVVLNRRDDTWYVESEGDNPADPSLISNILDNLGDLRRTDLVSTQEERHSVFQTDTSGVEVKIEQGGETTAWFVVGKGGSDFMSNYVRMNDEDEVYRVPLYLRSYVDRGEDTWRNKLLLDLEESEIASFTTVTPDDTVRVEKDASGSWVITQPFEAPASADLMPVVTSSLARVQATAFVDTLSDLASVGLEQDTMSVSITTTDGKDIKIVIGIENERRQFLHETRRLGHRLPGPGGALEHRVPRSERDERRGADLALTVSSCSHSVCEFRGVGQVRSKPPTNRHQDRGGVALAPRRSICRPTMARTQRSFRIRSRPSLRGSRSLGPPMNAWPKLPRTPDPSMRRPAHSSRWESASERGWSPRFEATFAGPSRTAPRWRSWSRHPSWL